MPALDHADGIWLDGNGYDNGAWMCSGVCCGYGPTNSPHNAHEIEQFCLEQKSVATTVRKELIAHGGFDGLNCMTFRGSVHLPVADDAPDACSQKLMAAAVWAANHSNYHAVTAYGSDTGGMEGYNDSTAEATVAAFMIMRGQHWFLSIGVSRPCNPSHYPVSGRCHSDGCGKPCKPGDNAMDPVTAALLVTDYGRPLEGAHAVHGRTNEFERRYEKATVRLDCNRFEGFFDVV